MSGPYTVNMSCTKSEHLNVSCLVLLLFLPNLLKPCVWSQNEGVVGAAPTGDAPTTPSDQQVYYLLRRDLHKRFDGIRDPYFVMAKLAVDLLPNGARPSADNNADNRVRQVPLTIMFSIHPSFTRWRHSKWSARSREISELFANLCSSMYCQQYWKTAMLHS